MEEHIKFIAGDPGAERPFRDVAREAQAGLAYVLVAAVMTEVIVDPLEVIEIQMCIRDR